VRHLLGAQRVQFLGRHVAAIDLAGGEHLRDDLAIAVHPLHLEERPSS
jgi:hypothetical protein